MRREEMDEVVDCATCGKPVNVARERGFQGAGNWALCWACAVQRGAHFDEAEDRWTVPPDPAGLPIENEHKIR